MHSSNKTSFSILFLIAIAHLLNDLLQAVIPAIYPQLRFEFNLNMAEVGVITLCYQLSASIFQPLVGNYTDKHPLPYSQMIGLLFSGLGIALLSVSPSYEWVLVAVVMVGIGSSIFHPESSRVAYLASGEKRSLAQAIFQLGGNTGTAVSPLLILLLVIPYGKKNVLWFVVIAILAIIILFFVGRWRSRQLELDKNKQKKQIKHPNLTSKQINGSILILLVLIFSKYFYTASITNYFQFYTIERFGFSQSQAQVYLFYFLGASAVGTLLGGYFGDRFGRRFVIWFSILGVAPFTLILPYLDVELTAVCIVCVGLIISSAFPTIIVYAQELLPEKMGMISGMFYGFAFGMAGVGSAVLGKLIDLTDIYVVYTICSFLPLIGLITYFLPKLNFRE